MILSDWDSTKKLLELTHELSKISEYKINMQNTVAFMYTNNKLAKVKQEKNLVYGSIKNDI